MSVARPAATSTRTHLAAWAIALVTLAFALVAIALIAQTPHIPFISESWGFRGYDVVLAVASLPVGMVIALTRPSHPIGWLLLPVSLTSAVQAAADQYATRAHEVGEYSTVATVEAWVPQWIWVTSVVCVVTVILVFPDGRAAGSRWRPFLRAFLVLSPGLTLLFIVKRPPRDHTDRPSPGFKM